MQSKSVHIAVQLNERIFHLEHMRVRRVQRIFVALQKLFECPGRSLVQPIKLRLQRLVARLHLLASDLMATTRALPHGPFVQRIAQHLFASFAFEADDCAAKGGQLGRIDASATATLEALGKSQVGTALQRALQRLRVRHIYDGSRGNIHYEHM